MSGVVEKVLLGDGDEDEPGLRDLIAAIVKISDSLDRLTALVEDVADALGREDWYGQR